MDSKKLASAHKILDMCPDTLIELAYSGGKDSDVILHLARTHGLNIRPIYKRTTIDPPYTIQHVRESGVEVYHPQHSFFELVRTKGLPSRFARFCCSYLKEYKIMDHAILGVRAAESAKRASRYTEPTRCRMFSKTSIQQQYLPIYDWTDQDVYDYITENHIQLHPLYYHHGDLDVTCRLGCIGCPLASRNKRIEQLKLYPQFVKTLAINADIYCQSHNKPFNGWDYVLMNLTSDWSYLNPQLFPLNSQKLLTNFFNIN